MVMYAGKSKAIRPGKPKRAGGDSRGSSYRRRERKHKLLATFGDGSKCPCAHCGRMLEFASVEADRIVPARGYRWENVIPACRECNNSRSDNAEWRP